MVNYKRSIVNQNAINHVKDLEQMLNERSGLDIKKSSLVDISIEDHFNMLVQRNEIVFQKVLTIFKKLLQLEGTEQERNEEDGYN